jgi:hypothetical protein
MLSRPRTTPHTRAYHAWASTAQARLTNLSFATFTPFLFHSRRHLGPCRSRPHFTLGLNITGAPRRREEGTHGDGGDDEGGVGGLLGGSVEDGTDVLVHAKPWRRTRSSSTTSVVPSSWPYSVPYSYEYQNFSPAWFIFIWSHTCNLFSSVGIINGVKQPSWITQPITEPVHPPISLMILCLWNLVWTY